MSAFLKEVTHDQVVCGASARAVRDALDTLNGKWKLPLIVVLQHGAKRFKEIQRELEGITPKVLSKELKELELHGFVARKVYTGTPVSVTYELTPYSQSLEQVLEALKQWGMQHRERIKDGMRQAAAAGKE